VSQQVVEVELAVGEALARPLSRRPVPRELEIVAVRVGEIDRFVRAVIGELPQRDAGVDEPLDRLRELGA
jgi:hypothetical protein